MSPSDAPDFPRRAELARDEIARLVPGATVTLADVFARACELAADALEVERVGVWLFVDDRRGLRCASLFERSKREHSEGATLRVADFPAYFAALDRLAPIPAADAVADPITAELADAYLAPLGIASMLDAPLVVGGRVVGVVCHEHAGDPRVWSAEERGFARAVADLLALKLATADRSDAQTALRTRSDQVSEARRLDSLGQLAAGVAHDFKNLLTVIVAAAELVQQKPGLPADARELLRQIVEAAEKGAELTRELTRCARDTAQATRVVGVADAVGKTLPLLRAAAGPDHPVEFHRGPGSGRVLIDPAQLERVLLNLVVNARDATPAGGPIRVTVHAEPQPGGPYAQVEVRDFGTGIDPAVADRIFDPFFTTKGAEKGTGLGLAVVKQVVDRAGGFVTVHTEPGRGTAFRVHLPRVMSGE